MHLQFNAAEIAHQLESAVECNKLIVKKAVLDAGLQEYDTFVRYIVILIFPLGVAAHTTTYPCNRCLSPLMLCDKVCQ